MSLVKEFEEDTVLTDFVEAPDVVEDMKVFLFESHVDVDPLLVVRSAEDCVERLSISSLAYCNGGPLGSFPLSVDF